MGILDGKQKQEPMHYGEVFGAWNYLMVAQSTFIQNQVMLNHTGDKDLIKFLEDYNNDVLKPQIKELSDLLKINGVELPPSAPERPKANFEDIPAGARLLDSEIANTRAQLLATGLLGCSQIMGNSTREDIGLMFEEFHKEKAKLAGRILKLLKEKGWLMPPPLHISGDHHI